MSIWKTFCIIIAEIYFAIGFGFSTDIVDVGVSVSISIGIGIISIGIVNVSVSITSCNALISNNIYCIINSIIYKVKKFGWKNLREKNCVKNWGKKIKKIIYIYIIKKK